MKQQVFLGPPGTGKTTTLLNTVQKLIADGFHPKEIAFVSFTKKAAMEAKERALAKFKDLTAEDLPNWNTLHSICFKRIGVQRGDVMGKQDWKAISALTGSEMFGYYNVDDGQLAGGTEEGDKFLFHNGLAHARLLSPDDHYETLHKDERYHIDKPKFLYFCETLTEYKRDQGKLDFNDMLEHAEPMGELPGVRVAIIDEAQDLSKRQWQVARSLFANCEQVIIAGDDDQSIYEWSGADLETFLNLSGTKTVLNKSYRLPRKIFDFANKIVNRISPDKRLAKIWEPDDREGSVKTITAINQVQDAIVKNDGQTWLVLARNKYMLNEAVEHFRSWGVPYAEKGKPAVQQNDIQAILAYEACRAGKVISPANAQQFYNYLLGNGRQIARGYKSLPPTMPMDVTWQNLVDDFGLRVDQETEWYNAFMESKINSKTKAYYRSMRRNGYATSDLKVNVSTIHSIKGGEADNVIVIDSMARRTFEEFENVNPDAEHRVFYVAVTRARENLFILDTGSPSCYPF